MGILEVQVPKALQQAYDESMDAKIAWLACILDQTMAARQQQLDRVSDVEADVQYVQYTFCKADGSSTQQVMEAARSVATSSIVHRRW